MLNRIKKWKTFYHPDRFQGWGKNRSYFEGWYFKIVNANGSAKFAIIPGVAMDSAGNKQAFIQILDGTLKTSEYIKFPFEDFHPGLNKMEFNIQNNQFGQSGIKLDLPSLKGEIYFDEQVKWPVSIRSPGIMGPFAYAPFMECYHGIVSMNHALSGQLGYHNQLFDFNGGKGYIEKDWGRSFPSAYVWTQSNHFLEDRVSFKASVAKIPWLRSSFTGFIAGLWLKNTLIRFTTYNRCSLSVCAIHDKSVDLQFNHPNYKLFVQAEREESTTLSSPIFGAMTGKIEESMHAKIHLRLMNKKNNQIIFEGEGIHAGLEVAGKINEIIIQ